MNDLFNPVSMALHALNTAILLAALYYFLYKPVRKFMGARADKIAKELNDARSAQDQANTTLEQSQQKLKTAERQASDTVAASAQQAQKQAEAIVERANQEAAAILDKARHDADAMVESTRATMVDEAAALAVEIAKKLLSREVKLDDHRRLIDDFRAKVG